MDKANLTSPVVSILDKFLRASHADQCGGVAFEEWLTATLSDEYDIHHCEAVVHQRALAGEY